MTIWKRRLKRMVLIILLLLVAVVMGNLYWSKPLHNYPMLTIKIQTSLVNKVKESSSLALFGDQLWTANDSGDDANLYQIDERTGQVVKQVIIANVGSEDWESLAQDDDHLYVMDCGNNKGLRKKRSIIKVERQMLMAADNGATLLADGTAHFAMVDQPAEGLTMFMHDYDCEAAAVVGTQLWIFSKNWHNQRSRRYSIDLNKITTSVQDNNAVQKLMPVQELDVDGLITAADYNAQTGQLVLLGYDSNFIYKHPFIWIIPVINQDIDWDMAKRFNLDPYGQWESILWRGNDQLLLTAEASVGQSARLGVIKLHSLSGLDLYSVKE